MSGASERRVLVTGASGMLGQDMVRTLRDRGHLVTAVGRDALDVTDTVKCAEAVEGHDIVVNTAAYTAVDDAEKHEADAFAVNAVGPANLARAAVRTGAWLVHVSTDYVFDGDATEPYAADHLPAPRSAYGRTKAAGEWAVRAIQPKSWIIRTAWLYGAGGPNFVATMLQLASERETLSVVADQTGQPTWTADVSDLLVRLIEAEAPAGNYHATSTGFTTWHGLATATLQEGGLDPTRVNATTSTAFPRPAPRPAYSVLSHDSLLAAGITPIGDWRDRLHAYFRSSSTA